MTEINNLTLIAGGSKGLGGALTACFKELNHRVIDFSRSGSSHNHVACDFSKPDTAIETIDQVFTTVADKNYQSINLIINTATLAPFGNLGQASAAEIDQQLAINITTTVKLIAAFLAHFQNNPAHKTLSYISSGAARRAIAGMAMYSASKAYFERLIDTIAAEQNNQAQPIKCMVINPGVMNTGMQAEIRQQSVEDFPMVEMWHDFHATGQLVEPEKIAQVVVDLITQSGEHGGYYTAQELL